MEYIDLSQRLPVRYEADICVVGGSCTGVFAAVRAAMLGARVVLIERTNCLGGTATNGLVNIWHSLYDTDFSEQVIGGLTAQMQQRLLGCDAAKLENNESVGIRFNSEILKIELDRLIQEHGIKLYLNTYYCASVTDNGRIYGVQICNKDMSGIIKAGFFIDATGDGDLCRDVGLKEYRLPSSQPPTSVFLMQGCTDGVNLAALIAEHGAEFGLDDDWGWNGTVPNLSNISMRADFHIFGCDCATADGLTMADIRGREQAYGLVRLLNKYSKGNYEIVSLCSQTGIRDTRHYETAYRADERSLLTGKRYESAVMNGTYRIDVHHAHDNGITFKYLDGSCMSIYGKDGRKTNGEWKTQLGFFGECAKYYQVPFELLVQDKCPNLIAAGRMINADEGAFGALRVMVNLNQLGEAAGVGAYLSLQHGCDISRVSGVEVRELLRRGGSAL